MATFKMTCTCGDTFEVDAKDRDEAVEKIQSMMSEEAIGAHMEEKHEGQPVPPVSMVHQMVAQMTTAA
jgi:hypothetical protein